MRYGMIPELVGRLPVTVCVDPLDTDALRAILTRPRNALVRQYQRLFEMDDVQLEFTPSALDAAAGAGPRARNRRPRAARHHRSARCCG